MTKPAAERLLSKRAAKVALPWTVSIENQSAEAVSISESAVLRRIPQLQPLDHGAMALLVAESQQNSGWARAGRLALDVTALATFFGAASTTATGALRWGHKPLFWLSATTALGPQVAQRIRGTAQPVQQNFESLAWVAPVTIQPGDGATCRVFTIAWEHPQAVSFVIETSRVTAAKVVQ